MKILLIKSPVVRSNFVPLGLGYVAAVLEKAGYSVRVLDMTVQGVKNDNLTSFLSTFKPDIVGITCMNTEFEQVLNIASICKHLMPTAKVIIGGPFPSSMPEIFLSRQCVDVVVMGEGEITIVETIERIGSDQSLKGVKGIAYKNGNAIKYNPLREPILDLDSIPFPARHLLRMERYISSFDNWFGGIARRATNMISSRGCPYQCIYCDKHVFGHKWRGRNAKNIVDEIQFLMKRYHIDGIIFSDDMFDLDKKRVYQICDEIESRNIDIIWGCNSRLNHANVELYKRMYKAGCRFVAFGIESGNQEILDIMRRNVSLKQAIDAVNMAKRVGLRAIGYFMIGMLGENRKTILDTKNFARGLNLDAGAIAITTPLPRTVLYELAEKEGLIKSHDWSKWDRAQATVNLTRDLTKGELERIAAQANWEFFWSRPSRGIPRVLCDFIPKLSPIVGWTFGSHYWNVILWLDQLRQKFHLPFA